MHKSEQFKDFYSFIHAIDILDAKDNAVIVWADPDADEHQVTFTTFGKPRRVKMILLENDKVTLKFYDSHVSGPSHEAELTADYMDNAAKYMINFLKTGDL